MSVITRAVTGVAGVGAACLAYGSLYERNAFTLRHFDVPVLTAGSAPLRVLHISDLHMMARQQRKQAWIRDLATLKPDLVINTGDHVCAENAVPALIRALEPLMEFPGAFVPGNNDYYAAIGKSPVRYFQPPGNARYGKPLPWPAIAAAITDGGWLDLTHARKTLTVGAAGASVALAGTDDPHLRKARYSLIAGAADPAAVVRIGVTHSPEPFILKGFAADGYDLVLAGHTHGGQVRVPFGPAITTNCGIDVARARWLHPWDEHMYFHVCAGLGTSPYMPIRFACRPEASLLTLTARAD